VNVPGMLIEPALYSVVIFAYPAASSHFARMFPDAILIIIN